MAPTAVSISARGLTTSYGERRVLDGLDLDIPAGAITSLIGPNGCGKSTLLKSLATVIPSSGKVTLGGEDITAMKRIERARRLSMLPQHPVAPDALTVFELVARGRHPHQSWAQRWSTDDEEHVRAALALTATDHLAPRAISTLSGGQRQRVWIAMVLAQDTPTIFLDEPTTYLDLAHSIDILKLVGSLREREDKTVVMVLHDLNLAIRHSDFLVAMLPGGTIHSQGTPEQVITPQMLREVFGLDALVVEDPAAGGPLVVPGL